MTDINQTRWFIHALTGDQNSVIDWRCIHDKDRARPAHTYRGTLAQCWNTLQEYNGRGYGISCTVNMLDGNGLKLANVQHIRAHVADLDNVLTAQDGYTRAAQDGATFAVQSSPGKFHVYWKMHPYTGNEFYNEVQRKIRQVYDGDKSVIDPTRVMRVPGFMHLKNDPIMVTGWEIDISRVWTFEEIGAKYQHINVFDHSGTRSPLGTPEMSAPSLDWLKFALSLADPNDCTYEEWVSFCAAIKQSGWLHSDEPALFKIWSDWCERYESDDPGETLKVWNSIRDSEIGWKSLERKTPVKAYMAFGFKDAPQPMDKPVQQLVTGIAQTIVNDITQATARHVDTSSEIFSEFECAHWFKDCFFIKRMGKILSDGRFMDSTQFNGSFGGKQFIITSTGKITDEPWKAALRSTCYTIPKVDHVRFLPDRKTFEIIPDSLGRNGLNTYVPAIIKSKQGDVSLWLDHVARILPVEADRRILFEFLAHAVKFPGYKIPWAPMIQGAEGIGKTVFREVLENALGDVYVYNPKAPELVASGSKFNAWMRSKLMIIVDEIKIDERRELIEILKPMITDKRVEVQSKGVDQDMEDNVSNWLFFSNYRDAIPVNQNGRRYSIFYSCLQSEADILNAGMGKVYFDKIWNWLRTGGVEAVTHWLMTYPIERGALPVRAPETSSHTEAIAISRSPIEVVIADCIADELPGFRGGYISTIAVIQKIKAAGIRTPALRTVQNCLETMGFVSLGRAQRAHGQEDFTSRADIYATLSSLPVSGYGAAQGYE